MLAGLWLLNLLEWSGCKTVKIGWVFAAFLSASGGG